jgi:uncharacterized protein (TIGR00375 family)
VTFTYADLHIHSKYSRACSRDCDLEHLAWWARRKGIGLVGTGDVTHPAWAEELRTKLVPAEPGLYRLREDLDREVLRTLPASCRGELRFLLQVEISTIYKRGERTRKVHHLCYLPDVAAVGAFTARLARIGNLGSDGRPILGLDSRDLLEITLSSGEGAYLVPAHIWTPWFAVLGSKSGFDVVDECYGELAEHVVALETGLSSEPAMNWRVPSLDRYRLVSNSDAHSPGMLGRNATQFDLVIGRDLDYASVHRALATGAGYGGTVDMYPEEGKYHLDGHRACDVRLTPAESRALDDRCPECGKPLTIGVLHRVEELARRPESATPPPTAGRVVRLVPLPEIMGEILGVGPKSKKVLTAVDELVARLGPELSIVCDLPLDEVAKAGSPVLVEALRRLRSGEASREGGYDGEYGSVRLFAPGEAARFAAGDDTGGGALFELPTSSAPRRSSAPSSPRRRAGTPSQHPATEAAATGSTPRVPAPRAAAEPDAAGADVDPLLRALDPDQRAAAAAPEGPLLIVAGPGTGKTRTLTHRIAHLVDARGVRPDHCLAITFTRRAAEELRERCAALLTERANELTVTTFHGLGLTVLREQAERAGFAGAPRVIDRAEQLAVVAELTGEGGAAARRALQELTEDRRAAALAAFARHGAAAMPDGASGDEAATEPVQRGALTARYEVLLRERCLTDFDDLLTLPVTLLAESAELRAAYRDRFRWIFVDEYQDVDELQYALLRLLAPPHANLCAIGDPDQAIYGFRGADVGFFLRFERDFDHPRTVSLGRNYRSRPVIVAGALAAVAPATLVPGRRLDAVGHTSNGTSDVDALPDVITVRGCADEAAEAAFVVRAIDELLGGSSFHSRDSGAVRGDGAGGLSFDDIAILYRTDAQARPLVEALSRAGMPFQKRSHDRLSDRPGVPELARALARDAGYGDAGALIAPRHTDTRSVATDAGLFELDHDLIDQDAFSAGEPLSELLRRAARQALDGRVEQGEPAGAAMADLEHTSRDRTDIDREAELLAAVELLTPLATRYDRDVRGFLTALALGAEVDTWDPRADRVSLLTLHASKGLEFPVVFLVGCESGLLPLRWAGSANAASEDNDAEERRLLFVGMTRARERLYLSHAARRTRQGTTRETGPSPFLDPLRPAAFGAARVDWDMSAAHRRRPQHQLRLL